jgi:Tfp pilus assembly protein PilV
MIVLLRRLHRDERGAGLVEALVATTLLGVAMVVLMGSFSTLALASRQAQQVASAQALARSQAARLKAAPYVASGDYGAYYEPLPAGLTRTVSTSWWTGAAWSATQNSNGLQQISLTIRYDGTPVATLAFAKADR